MTKGEWKTTMKIDVSANLTAEEFQCLKELRCIYEGDFKEEVVTKRKEYADIIEKISYIITNEYEELTK